MIDPALTAKLLQDLLAAGTVQRFDLLHEALTAAEQRGVARERARRRELAMYVLPGRRIPLS